jgi:hypothetical protein
MSHSSVVTERPTRLPTWVVVAIAVIAVIAVVGLWAAAVEPDPRCVTSDACAARPGPEGAGPSPALP